MIMVQKGQAEAEGQRACSSHDLTVFSGMVVGPRCCVKLEERAKPERIYSLVQIGLNLVSLFSPSGLVWLKV